MNINDVRKYYILGMYETLAILDTKTDWVYMIESLGLFRKNYINQGFRKGELVIMGTGIGSGKSVIWK